MTKKQYYIDRAIQNAYNSDMTFKHGAVIVKGGKVIADGWNSSYGGRCIRGDFSMHAERDAIFDCLWRRVDISGADIYVVRISKTGILQNSRPCPRCSEQIIKHGIVNIYYSISE
jgi:deoxycytidylate deaminase